MMDIEITCKEIIGSGDIASVLNPRDGAIFFAAGISNSSMTGTVNDERESLRELARLTTAIGYANYKELSFFYFGSMSCFFSDNWYARHKIQMESVVKKWASNYNIIRIGNIDWGTNPNTFLNYIRAKKAKGEPVEIRDEWKFMISKEQLRLVCDSLPLTGKNEISVFGECKKVKDLI